MMVDRIMLSFNEHVFQSFQKFFVFLGNVGMVHVPVHASAPGGYEERLFRVKVWPDILQLLVSILLDAWLLFLGDLVPAVADEDG